MNALADCHRIALVKAAAERERLTPALQAAAITGGITGVLGAKYPAAVMGAEAKMIEALGKIKPMRGFATGLARNFWERFAKTLGDTSPKAWKTRLRYGGRAGAAGAILAGSLAALIGREKR